MQAEITAIVQMDQRSITVKVSEDDVTKDQSRKIAEMQMVVNELLQPYASSAPTVEHKVRYLNNSPEKRVSDKQIGLIKFLLGKNGKKEQTFCREHSIAHLSEMSMADARRAIQELKTSNMFDEN